MLPHEWPETIPPLNSREFATICADNSMRVAWILPMATLGDSEQFDGPLNDFLQTTDADDFERTFGVCISGEQREAIDDSTAEFAQWAWSRGMFGYLVRFEVDQWSYHGDSGVATFSGATHLKVIYVADIGDIGPKLFEFKGECYARDRARKD
jgi:hypothetical protein